MKNLLKRNWSFNGSINLLNRMLLNKIKNLILNKYHMYEDKVWLSCIFKNNIAFNDIGYQYKEIDFKYRKDLKYLLNKEFINIFNSDFLEIFNFSNKVKENIAISNDNFDRFEDLGPIVGFEAEGVMAEDYTSIGYFVWSTMEKFCQSAGHEPLLEHIPAKAVQWHDEAKSAMYPYVEWAHNCFKVCANIKDTRLPIKHDIYLKCAQLNGAQFVHRKMGKLFEIVLLDEAQDVSECQSALVRDQHDAARFLIGDPHQSIYQFRGSDHALERVRSTLTNMFKLQTSFRFGQNIERAANLILWWKRCVIHIVTKGKGGKFGKPVKMNLLGGKKNC